MPRASGEHVTLQSLEAKSRHKAGAAKGQRVCDACQRKKDLAEFALNQSKCTRCKATLDVVSKMAKRQGAEDWWQKVRNNPTKLKTVVESYDRSSLLGVCIQSVGHLCVCLHCVIRFGHLVVGAAEAWEGVWQGTEVLFRFHPGESSLVIVLPPCLVRCRKEAEALCKKKTTFSVLRCQEERSQRCTPTDLCHSVSFEVAGVSVRLPW